MPKKTFLLLLLFFISLTEGFSQFLFEEKFKGCVTNQFTLEKDSVTVPQNDKDLLNAILGGVTEKDRATIRGVLTVQILIDEQGNSCLLSLRNETSYKTKRWHLSESIHQNLKWPTPKQKVAVVLAAKFTEKGVQFRRFGIDGSKLARDQNLNIPPFLS